MAAITTTAAGNWSATGTWTGGTVPGDGDTVTLNHAVTVDQNTVVGSAPATGGTVAVRANAPLTIASGVSLELKGDLELNDVLLTVNAGASILGNPASGVEYYIYISAAWAQAKPKMVCNGTSGSHVTIRKKSGAAGTFAVADHSFVMGGRVEADYTDFINLGSATIYGMRFYSDGSIVDWFFRAENCTFNGCGRIGNWTGIVRQMRLRWRRCVWTNSVDTYSLYLSGGDGPVVGGERTLDHCAFDDAFVSLNLEDVAMTECRVVRWEVASSTSWNAATRDNLIHRTTGTNAPSLAVPQGTTRRVYYVHTLDDNPHYFDGWADATHAVEDIVFENLHASVQQTGDCLIAPQASTTITMTMKRCLVLPSSGGRGIGSLLAMMGNASITVIGEHNTYCADTDECSAAKVGESYNGHAGMLGSLRSNLFWNATSRSGQYLLNRYSPSTVQDIAAAANVDYNGRWNLSAGNDGGGINHQTGGAFFASGSAGAHDVVLSSDPFVDSSRNLTAWGAAKGDANVAETLAHLFALDSGYEVADLLDWVKAGFRVHSSSGLGDAGHDGVTIGSEPVGLVVEQEGLRFRNDDGSETTATWAAAQDTNITAPANTTRRLRMLTNFTEDPPAIARRLEVAKSGYPFVEVEVDCGRHT